LFLVMRAIWSLISSLHSYFSTNSSWNRVFTIPFFAAAPKDSIRFHAGSGDEGDRSSQTLTVLDSCFVSRSSPAHAANQSALCSQVASRLLRLPVTLPQSQRPLLREVSL
jgi:hypothetical protein